MTDAPAETTDLIGRTAELEQLADAMQRSRLVTLTGAIGVGKSRLALRVAWTHEGSVVHRTADSLADLADLASADAHTLVIIDGAERDLTAVRDAVGTVLRTLAGVRVLVTSRMRLGLGMERVVTLKPLAVLHPAAERTARVDAARASDSVALLTARAADAVAGFALTEANADALLGICAAVDGLPLAIECAARALRVLDPERLQRALEEDVGIVDEFAPIDVATFGARFSTTWESCTADERDLAARLASAVDVVDIDMAHAVIGAPSADAKVAALLAGLADRSLIQPVSGDPTTFTLLRTTRHAVLARGDGGDAGLRVDDELVQLMRRAAEGWAAGGHAANIAALTRHQSAISALLERYCADPATSRTALGLICGLRSYWHLRTTAPAPRARDWIEAALRVDDAEDELRVRALRVDAYIALFESDELGAADQLAEADALARRIGAADSDGFGALVGGLLHLAHHQLADAERCFDEALTAALRIGIHNQLGELYWYLALLRLLRGDLDSAELFCEKSQAVSLENGDEWGDAYTLWMVALVALRRGESERALTLVRRSITAISAYQDRSGVALCVQLMASIAAQRGDLEQAARLMGTIPDPAIPKLSISEITPELAQQIRAELGADLFDRLFGAAAGMSPRDAIEYAVDHALDLVPPPAPQRGPLTAREWEVAELIADGDSNADIATTLYISRRTVEGHVQRMLDKLDFRSRAQVAAWVVTERLRADRMALLQPDQLTATKVGLDVAKT